MDRSRGMVIMMALIMLTMLGMAAASAMRSASISVSDVAWTADWLRIDETISRHLRDHRRELTGAHPIEGTQRITDYQSVVLVRRTTVIGQAHASDSPAQDGRTTPNYICHEITVTGDRRGIRLAQQLIYCRDQAGDRPPLTSWRAIST